MARSYFNDREAARKEVAQLAQWQLNPTLTSDEVYEVVDRCQRATYWEAATLYYAGTVLMPTIPNGHRYLALETGTSDATEPTWPLADYTSVRDGDSDTGLLWVEAGSDFRNVFDVRQAVYEAWMVKAAKASREIDVTLAGGANAGTFAAKCAQLYSHCVDMAYRSLPYRIT